MTIGTSGPDLSARIASAGDIPAVLELWRVAGNVPSITDNAAALHALLAHDPESLLVLVRDGRLLGALIVAWDGWRGSFYRLAVRPDERRRGLAANLVREGEARLRRRGAVRLQAIVAGEDATAHAFWEAAGYERQPDLRYVRSFEAAGVEGARGGPGGTGG